MKVQNKFYEAKYELTSPHFISDKQSQILVAGDIHYQPGVNKEIFDMLGKCAEDSQPDFIVMTGDQIETIDFIDVPELREYFEGLFDKLREIAPVIIIPGNHEIRDSRPNNFHKKNNDINDTNNQKAMKYFEQLGERENIFFLNNKQVELEGMMFLGFNPRMSSYLKVNNRQIEEEFIEDFIKSGLSIAESDYNILLTHSPLQLDSQNVLDSIKDFSITDLVITGHLHDGYLPKFLDKPLGHTNAGLFLTPLVAPYPGLICRGVHDFGRGYLFIAQGYRKWTPDLAITNLFEKISANDVEKLMISKGEKTIPIGIETMPYKENKKLS